MKLKGEGRRIAKLLAQGWRLKIRHGEPWQRSATIEMAGAKQQVSYRQAVKAAAYATATGTARVEGGPK